MIVFIALLMLQAPPSSDVCRRFTAAEIAKVLGATPAKPGAATLAGTCSWSVPGEVLTISAIDLHDAGAAPAMVGASKGTAAKGDTVKDEPGGAVSIVRANGRTVEFLSASGSVLWRFVVEASDKAMKTDTTLATLRALASKAR